MSRILEGSYVQLLINLTHKFRSHSSNAACVIPCKAQKEICLENNNKTDLFMKYCILWKYA